MFDYTYTVRTSYKDEDGVTEQEFANLDKAAKFINEEVKWENTVLCTCYDQDGQVMMQVAGDYSGIPKL